MHTTFIKQSSTSYTRPGGFDFNLKKNDAFSAYLLKHLYR
jgi:hypothetical protein